MPPIYLNQPSAISLPVRDRYQGHIVSSLNIVSDHTSSSSSSIIFHSLQDQDHRGHDLHQQQHLNQEQIVLGLSNCSLPNPITGGETNEKMELSLFSEYDIKEEYHAPGDWMPSKMRIMRKMTNSDRTTIDDSRTLQESEDQARPSKLFSTSSNKNSSPCAVIRVCSNCHTTKTPLWRSGPSGPKSLCNACGIRQRKARRAMAMAAAAAAAASSGGGGLIPAHAPAKVRKDKKLDVDHTVPFKKRCKFITAISTTTDRKRKKKKKKKICSEDHVTLSLSSTGSFHQVFPQDERDAAILLMALSYGLVLS